MARVLVENLPRHVIEKDMDDLFSRYGRIVSMQIKFPSREHGIAFVEYASAKQAEEASRELQGYLYFTNRLRAELFHPAGDDGPRSKVATQHRVLISHLPPSATTKDVKDLLSALSDVLAVEVDRRGSAWATFPTHYDLDRVVSKLDDADYRGERLRVKRDPTPIFSFEPKDSAPTTAASSSASRTSTTAPSPSSTSSRTSRNERTSSSTRSRSRSRERYRRRSSSRSPSRHRSSNDRRSRSPSNRSSSRRYRSRSRSR